MRLAKEEIEALRRRMISVRKQAKAYFAEAKPRVVVDHTLWSFRVC